MKGPLPIGALPYAAGSSSAAWGTGAELAMEVISGKSPKGMVSFTTSV